METTLQSSSSSFNLNLKAAAAAGVASHNRVLGISTIVSPSLSKINKPSSVLPTVRCRFRRSHGYSSRKAGAMSNVEVEAPNAATALPTSVPVRVAYELLQAGHRFLDVRTPEEFSAGHVPGAINIPYMFRLGSGGMAVNPNFIAQVSSQFGKDDEILIGCQSGKRSLMATNVLQSAGYTGIVDVAGGFVAWTQSELPTEM